MKVELYVLAWGCILALVHVFAAGNAKTMQYGTKWNTGPRDEEPAPPSPVTGRLMRAQANFFETFPLMVAAVLIISVAGLSSRSTEIGSLMWIGARIVYLPLYAMGIPVLRSLVFLVSLVGLLMVLWPALF
jgi:uncharacterized MAPEG superfamily protein